MVQLHRALTKNTVKKQSNLLSTTSINTKTSLALRLHRNKTIYDTYAGNTLDTKPLVAQNEDKGLFVVV